MNVFYKLTLQSLKLNKTRTVVTIIGVILSAAMICAVTTFVSSLQNYALEYSIFTDGDWHGAIEGIDIDEYEKISANDEVDSSAYGQILGYSHIESTNEYKPYLYIIGGEKDTFFKTMPIHLISGKYPENSSQIILPVHLSDNGGISYKVGDTFTLEIGNRLLDEYTMWQNNPCYTYDNNTGKETLNDEIIDVRLTRTYTVVGIYERPSFEERTAPGYTALTVSDPSLDDNDRLDIYIKLKNPAKIYDFIKNMGYDATYNSDVLLYSGVSKYASFYSVLYGLAAIVIGLIIFGSVCLIYNAFSISVSERTKQFGLLSSLGATKKQLRKTVLFEALAVSIIGIPIGIIIGIGGIGITLLLIGNKFSAMTSNGFDAPMRICVSQTSIIIAVIIALITVLISAWIPSKRATKVSAVEAIRQSRDIRTKDKPIKASKLTQKLFGLSGILAVKYYKRSRKKYRSTVISLFMSIVLFISASALTDYLMDSVTGIFSSAEYDIYLSTEAEDMGNKTADDILKLLHSDENLIEAVYSKKLHFDGYVDKGYFTTDYISITEQNKLDEIYVHGGAYFINDSEFDRLIDKYNLDKEDYYNRSAPLGIAIGRNTIFNGEKYQTVNTLNSNSFEMECSYIKEIDGYYDRELVYDTDGNIIKVVYQSVTDENDILEVPASESITEFCLKANTVISDSPFYLQRSSSMVPVRMIYPISMYNEVFFSALKIDDGIYRYYITSRNHKATYDNIKILLSENGLNSNYVTDNAANMENERNIINIIKIFSYGFIILISMIAAANVFNTISTNVSLRRREFAMLKSVGMDEKSFIKMMNYECLLYGSKALLLGIPVSCFVTYLIYLAISEGYETSFYLPWYAFAIAMLSVFSVVFAAMLYSVSKIKKDNPIDLVKNENL